MQSEDGELTYKLTQKVPAPDGRPGLVTTMYVDAVEYRTLAALPADVLHKARLSVPPFGVDVFEGALSGLLIGEVEFETRAGMDAYGPPPEVVAREITGDARFTCAALAAADESQVADVIAAGRGR
jgi:CYTH domain-containing protein